MTLETDSRYYTSNVGLVVGRMFLGVNGLTCKTSEGTRMARLIVIKLIVAIILFFAFQGCAMDRQNPETTILTGTIRIVGNEPFTKVILTLGLHSDISTIDQEYLIIGPLRDSLRRSYQGKKLRVEGAYCMSPDPVFKNCFNPARIVDSVDRSTDK